MNLSSPSPLHPKKFPLWSSACALLILSLAVVVAPQASWARTKPRVVAHQRTLAAQKTVETPAGTLSLEDYLSQVSSKNDGFRAVTTQADGALARSSESNLLTMPSAYINAQYTSEGKLQSPVFFLYSAQKIAALSAGILQMTSFGTQLKLHYDLTTVNLMDATIPPAFLAFGANAIPLTFVNAATVLEVTQSISGANAFGRGTRAQQDLGEASAMATHFNAKFQAKSMLAGAEALYWRLTLARQAVEVQKEALDRAQKIYEWNLKRSNLHLGEQSDVLQSEAMMQSRQLELSAALNEEKSACRAFNANRHMESEIVTETLVKLTPALIDQIRLPKRVEMREDVKAAQEQMKVASANATVQRETSKAKLELFGTLALNGQPTSGIATDLNTALSNSFAFNRPTQTIGIRLTAPLGFGTASDAREGWTKDQLSAEANYQYKVFQQDQDWVELSANYLDIRKQLELTQKLENIQASKLETERARLLKGRSTTYQVLLFEQDFLLAQLNRIRTQATIFNLISKMKLSGEST